jgi:two-component system KDP operon response regulator KdpE
MAEDLLRVLIVDDERPIRRFLKAALGGQFAVFEATTGAEALAAVATERPDVVLLDLKLPDMDGVEVTHRLREWSQVPIIVVSVREQETDKIAALDAGADDYLTKPFGVGELLARMRVALRRASLVAAGAGDSALETGDLRVDLAARRVFLKDEEVRLTRTEFNLLATLAKHAGKVLTHRQLLQEVWGPGSANESHYLRVYMGQLRHKLEEDAARPRYLLTETGVGYRLAVD